MNKNVRRLTLAAAVSLAIAGSNAMAEEMEEIVVKGDLGAYLVSVLSQCLDLRSPFWRRHALHRRYRKK